MKKILSVVLSTILLLSGNLYSFANISPDEESFGEIQSIVEQEVANQREISLKDFIIQALDQNIESQTPFEELSEEEKEMWGDLYTVAYISSFSLEDTQALTSYIMTNIKFERTSEVFNMFAGLFISHKNFTELRQRMVVTVGNPDLDLRSDNSVKFLTKYINVLKEAPILDDPSIVSSENEKIIPVLERKIRALSYLGQVPYNGSGTLPRRSTYLNEYAANRCFLEAYSYFAYNEDQSFLKGFVTPIIPIPHAPPSRNLNGEYLDDAGGRAHALAFDMEDMLIRYYVTNGQDNKVFTFIQDNGIRQGPFYFQFAVDGLSLASMYYESLEGGNAAARQQWWEEKSEEFVNDFKNSSPGERRGIVIGQYGFALAAEYVGFGAIFKFIGKNVLSPIAKAAFSLLPAKTQLRMLTMHYVFRGYIRAGMNKYLHDTPRYLFRRYILRETFLVADAADPALVKDFIKESLKRAGFAEGSAEYRFFASKTVTLSNFRNATEYISREEFEQFMRTASKIVTDKPIKIRVMGNTIMPEVEREVVQPLGKTLSQMYDLLRAGTNQVVETGVGANGEIFSIITTADGTAIRFGEHEMGGSLLHVHIEKQVTLDGASYLLNETYVINTKQALTQLISRNTKVLWTMSSESNRRSFITALRQKTLESESVGGRAQIPSDMRNYIYRLYDYFIVGGERGAASLGKMKTVVANATRKSVEEVTEEEAVDEILLRVLRGISSQRGNPILKQVYEEELLNKTLNVVAVDLSNAEAAGTLERFIIQNAGTPNMRGFGTMTCVLAGHTTPAEGVVN